MKNFRLTGLCAAAVTPLNEDGSLRLEQVQPIVERLIQSGVSGLYVCGSTGEGVSLTNEERKAVAESYVDASGGRLPVVVQVGQNSLNSARELAQHAQSIGADAISAMAPSYFKVNSTQMLIDAMTHLATAAPELPFYYYHIPALTGVDVNMVDFLGKAATNIHNLVGVKFTTSELDRYQQCLEFENGRYDVQWGVDEMLLGALATGATGGVGSTYNIAAPVYLRIIDAFLREDFAEARRWQSRSIAFIHIMANMQFHSSLREVLRLQGLDCGHCRLPQRRLTDSETAELKEQLEAIGFFEWCRPDDQQTRLRIDSAQNSQSIQPSVSSTQLHERT